MLTDISYVMLYFVRSIEELQGQNQRLLVVIRDLSEQKEKEELESGETK